MKNRYQNWWLLAGGIWVLVVFASLWNFSKVDALILAKEKNEYLAAQLAFEHQNIRKFKNISALDSALHLSTESINFGIHATKHRLKKIAETLGFADLNLTIPSEIPDRDAVPLKMSFRGSLVGAVEYLSLLENYPYLAIQSVECKAASTNGRWDVKVSMELRWRQLSPREIGTDPSQTADKGLKGEFKYSS